MTPGLRTGGVARAVGVNVQTLRYYERRVADLLDTARHRHGRRANKGLQARAQGKLAEVEQRLAHLDVVRDTLRSTLDAGCDDLVECANSPMPPAAVRRVGPTGGTDVRKTAAAVAGVVGCVACCAAPILLTAGLIGTGVAAAVATWLPWLSAVLIVGAFPAFSLHERRAEVVSCASDPVHDDGCGCQPTAEPFDTR